MFYDALLKTTISELIRIPTGGRGRAEAAKLACNDYAHKNRCTHWAQQQLPTREDYPVQWIVYRSDGLARSTPVKVFPTREAAEMWMVHLG